MIKHLNYIDSYIERKELGGFRSDPDPVFFYRIMDPNPHFLESNPDPFLAGIQIRMDLQPDPGPCVSVT